MSELYQSVPTQVQDWHAREKDEIYNRETLYNYINGGAELYLTYRFKEVFVRRFVKSDEPGMEIVLDIYDMGSSEDAFGIFSCEREDEDIGIGQDSEYGGGLLRFWKDRYFVSLVVLGDEQTAKPAMIELAHSVADVIHTTGEKPAVLSHLPEDGLIEPEIRYFHTEHCLNNHYFIASENILNLSTDTQCVFAPYRRNNGDGYLLLVRYTNEQQAAAAYESFVTTYIPEARDTGVARMENAKWTMVQINRQLLKIVFEAPDREWASTLLSGVINSER